MSELHHLTMHALAQMLAQGDISAVQATEACLRHIDATQDLGAYLYVDAVGARLAAQASDARRARGASLGPLDGIPMALKDIFLTAGLPTTCGSRILQDFIAPYDGTAVRKLKEAGVVLLGKLNMDEFAMGSSNEHSAFKPVKNPWTRRACRAAHPAAPRQRWLRGPPTARWAQTPAARFGSRRR